jgi:tRNA pseudouridine38-40 synthase
MRVKITLAYNGCNYFGFQIQKEQPKTVAGVIEHIFNKLGIHTKIVASGRTDRGVHATGQVIHIDLPEYWSDLQRLKTTLNKMLPNDIYIKKIKIVNKSFHARYSAKTRVYRYIIKEGESNPFEATLVTFVPRVNIERLEQNITLFEGEHDFTNFMKSGSDEKSQRRIIYRAFAYRHKRYIILFFEANGFLRSQIRMMVGALLNLEAKQIEEALNLRKRAKVKPAPPNGLYLAKIKY